MNSAPKGFNSGAENSDVPDPETWRYVLMLTEIEGSDPIMRISVACQPFLSPKTLEDLYPQILLSHRRCTLFTSAWSLSLHAKHRTHEPADNYANKQHQEYQQRSWERNLPKQHPDLNDLGVLHRKDHDQ